jgi:ATP-dependent DNA helicase RecG
MADRIEYFRSLLEELCKLPSETEWLEFKGNNSNPTEIGEYISALANSAALRGKANAYVIWGVADDSHEVQGTTFRPTQSTEGDEELKNWLLRLLSPQIHFHFFEFEYEGKAVSMVEIPRATHQPVAFRDVKYIRVGSYKKKLKDHPEIERSLWRILNQTSFEEDIAAEHVSAEEVVQLLDYPAYFQLTEIALPTDRDSILAALQEDDLIQQDRAGAWDIINLGAVLFAANLGDFRQLKRKAMRVIQYRGSGRIETVKEQMGAKGYAAGFAGLLDYINAQIPSNEVIGQALRKTVPMFPALAVRELVANALIHQNFSVTGAGPMVEIFDDRMEITNPGKPLVKPDRFLGTPPKSRNEALASLMRRIGICEERGSGISKVVFQIEFYQLPAPLFEAPGDFTRAVLFAHKKLTDMDKAERVRACYLHACLRRAMRQPMSNATVRARFGLNEKSSATASGLLKEAVEAGRIVIEDPTVGKKRRRYLPFWARKA